MVPAFRVHGRNALLSMKTERAELIPTRWSLINRLKNLDDSESWKDFFDTYWRLIYSVAMKSGMTDAESQDVVQDTIISVSKKIKDFKADPAAGSFKAWLLKLTRWRILDQVRKRLPAAPVTVHRSADTSTTSTIERVPDPASLALEDIWDAEWKENLTKVALERLQRQVSNDHYQIFYLNVVRGKPAETVAKALGVKTSQVYLVKHRVYKLFEQVVKDLEAETT